MRAQARALTETKARPGGRASAFWLPTTTTSTPQACVSRGSAPAPEIASTTSSVSGRARVMRARASHVVARRPSTTRSSWTKTARMAGSASSARATSSGATASPHFARSSWTSIPWARPIAVHRSPKEPATSASIVSPGERTLTSAASIPPVPEQARIKTSSVVFRNALRPVRHSEKTLRNSSVR